MDKEINIIAIRVLDRIKEAGRLQNSLSKHSKVIKTRFGYHELNDYKCSRSGLLILELQGNNEECDVFLKELKNIGGIIVEVMTFNN
jgi:hypothetical protein